MTIEIDSCSCIDIYVSFAIRSKILLLLLIGILLIPKFRRRVGSFWVGDPIEFWISRILVLARNNLCSRIVPSRVSAHTSSNIVGERRILEILICPQHQAEAELFLCYFSKSLAVKIPNIPTNYETSIQSRVCEVNLVNLCVATINGQS